MAGFRRIGRMALGAALAAMTALEVMVAGVARMAYREMAHEGLTQSQWYVGSIESYYRALFILVFYTGLWLAALAAFWRPKKRAHRPASPYKRLWCVALAGVAAALTLGAIHAHAHMAEVCAADAQAAEMAVRAFGRLSVGALLAIDALLGVAYGRRIAGR